MIVIIQPAFRIEAPEYAGANIHFQITNDSSVAIVDIDDLARLRDAIEAILTYRQPLEKK